MRSVVYTGTWLLLSALSGVAYPDEPPAPIPATVVATVPRVAVDLTALDADTFRDLAGVVLERQILVRLVQEGFAVVSSEQRPEIVLVLAKHGAELEIRATGPGGQRTLTLVLDPVTRAELRLEIAQKAIELARSVSHTDVAAPAIASSAASVPRAETLASSAQMLAATATPAKRRNAGEVELTSQVLWRAHAIDPLFGLGLRLRSVGSLRLIASAAWSTSAGTDLRAHEWQGVAGASHRLVDAKFRRRLTWDVGVAAGVLVHSYRLSTPGLSRPSGTRVDLLVVAPVRLCYWLTDSLGLALTATPGITTARRAHTLGEQILWERGRWRLEAGISAIAAW